MRDFRLNRRNLASGAKLGFPNTHIFASLYLTAIKRESLSLFFVFRQLFAAMRQVSGYLFILRDLLRIPTAKCQFIGWHIICIGKYDVLT